MAYAACLSEAAGSALGARALMQEGYNALAQDPSIIAGGSTACVGIAKEDGSLEVANLGDSGFIQLRLNAIRDRSEPQSHASNAPYQLSIIPKEMQATYGEDLHDMPEEANVTKHLLRHGDVLIFATDGVWDNLTHQDVLKVVSRFMFSFQAWDHTEEGIQVGERLAALTMPGTPASESGGVSSLQSILASGIVKEAEAASVNKHVDGPYVIEVNRLFPTANRRGGKVDDICVIVAIVVEEHGVQTNAASEPELPSAKRQPDDNSIMGSQKRHKSHAEPTDPESSFHSFITSTDEMSHSSSDEEAESRFSASERKGQGC
jgi:protein phosphatase PTC7